MHADIVVAVPEAIGEGHGMFIHRRQPEHEDRGLGMHRQQKLFKTETERLCIQRLSAVRPSHPGGVIEAHRQKQGLRCLPAQFPAAHPFPFPAS